MKTTVTAADAKTHFSRLLRHVEAGDDLGLRRSPEPRGADALRVDIPVAPAASVLPRDDRAPRAVGNDLRRFDQNEAHAHRLPAFRPDELAGTIDPLRGDLDGIVMKALEKDRKRRYETPGTFAADLEAHLLQKPVSAAAPALIETATVAVAPAARPAWFRSAPRVVRRTVRFTVT